MNTMRSAAFALAQGKRVTLLAAAFLAAAAQPSWAQSKSEDEPVVASRAWEMPATLKVQNNNWLDVHVYLVRDGGLPRSLGVVSGPGQSEIELPGEATFTGSLIQILVEPIGGGGSYLSQGLVISPGDRVDLTVQNTLGMSSESVAGN